MSTSKKTLRVLTLSALLSANVHATGIPVIDASAIAQLVMEFMVLQEQLSTQQSNLQQVTETKENFVGEIDYYANLINSVEFRKTADGYIPVNANEVLAIIKDGMAAENPEIAATIDRIMAASPALEELTGEELKTVLENSRKNMAYYQAAYQEAYNAAGKRQEMAVQLGQQSASVKNEKEARALGLAIQSEGVVATNEVARLLAMEQMKQSMRETEEQNKKELDSLIMQSRKEYFEKKKNELGE